MLTELKFKALQDLLSGAGREELVWINGYLSGILKGDEVKVAEIPNNAVTRKVSIVYGTETGNAKRTATELAAKAKKNHFLVKLASLDQYRLTDLTKEENLLVVISTQGDGEPPVAAQKFYDHIHHNGFRLDNLKYSVLALGDTSYPLFCKTGEEVDTQLQKLGGKRLVPVQKCDLDYEADADKWFNEVMTTLQSNTTTTVPTQKQHTSGIKLGNKQIHSGKVLTNTNLNDIGSRHITHHIELEAEGVDYQPGDSIGIVPANSVEKVNQVLSLLPLAETQMVKHKEANYTVRDLLIGKVNIHYLHERVINKYASIVKQEIPETKMDLLDLLKIYPVTNAEQSLEVLESLPAQSPRIYTIASSPGAHAGEIHLTVEKDTFLVGGEMKTGTCSDYLISKQPDESVDFFVQKNKRFRLPEADKDIIMIGPGTGIAAFRSFLSERDAIGATGRNWLFFGESRFVSDFLYQTEIQDWFATGVLSKVSLAFSDEQPKGLFVWHKLLEQGKELFAWIQSGAHIYVCGQKSPMSLEVEKAVLQIVETYSGLSATETMAYFEKLKSEGRYAKDVY